jgi:histidinol dehydrogenase
MVALLRIHEPNEFGLKNLKDTIVRLAEAEGFQGHVASVEKRFG